MKYKLTKDFERLGFINFANQSKSIIIPIDEIVRVYEIFSLYGTPGDVFIKTRSGAHYVLEEKIADVMDVVASASGL